MSGFLEAIGEDPRREGLMETPARVARMYRELLSGAGVDPVTEIDTVFEADHQDPVVLSNIPFHSMCEHHILPFFGTAGMAYIPNQKIAGVSKLARTLDVAAPQAPGPGTADRPGCGRDLSGPEPRRSRGGTPGGAHVHVHARRPKAWRPRRHHGGEG